jgi:hypothetical protein
VYETRSSLDETETLRGEFFDRSFCHFCQLVGSPYTPRPLLKSLAIEIVARPAIRTTFASRNDLRLTATH